MASHFLRDKIFKIDLNALVEKNEPRFVHFKIKKLTIEGVEKTMVQIIDVSHKMLYSEV